MEWNHNKNDESTETKLVEKGLNGNPYRNFSNAFALMAIIPFLVFFYVLTNWLSSIEILTGKTGFVLFLSICISMGGFVLGYKLLKELVSYTAKTIRKDASKSSMIATVSHDLKNPLAVLTVNIESMLDGSYGEIGKEQIKILQFCQRVTGRMQGLINDMLDLYKIESGRVKMQRKLCDIDEIIEKQAKEFENMLGKKRIQLIRENLGKELKVWADENKITQVVNNLLGNAVKYTPEEGKIGVKVVPVGESVRLEFADSGKSIPPDKLEKIFDEFERAGAGQEGEGLGLAIAKDIVELHDGKIWAESQPKGNKFVVVLPRDLRKED